MENGMKYAKRNFFHATKYLIFSSFEMRTITTFWQYRQSQVSKFQSIRRFLNIQSKPFFTIEALYLELTYSIKDPFMGQIVIGILWCFIILFSPRNLQVVTSGGNLFIPSQV